MTLADLRPVIQQASRNERAGWDWVLLRPSMVIELCESVAKLEAAESRLAQIDAIIHGDPPTIGALCLWAENDRDGLREALGEIGELALETSCT